MGAFAGFAAVRAAVAASLQDTFGHGEPVAAKAGAGVAVAGALLGNQRLAVAERAAHPECHEEVDDPAEDGKTDHAERNPEQQRIHFDQGPDEESRGYHRPENTGHQSKAAKPELERGGGGSEAVHEWSNSHSVDAGIVPCVTIKLWIMVRKIGHFR